MRLSAEDGSGAEMLWVGTRQICRSTGSREDISSRMILILGTKARVQGERREDRGGAWRD